jgi:hypothetical protein
MEEIMVVWTINEVANHIKRDKQTIYGYVRDGKIPFIKRPSGAIEFDSHTIMQWWAGKTHDPATGSATNPANEGEAVSQDQNKGDRSS